eukprot:PhF_6_TR18949/c0_g1_i3/m.27781
MSGADLPAAKTQGGENEGMSPKHRSSSPKHEQPLEELRSSLQRYVYHDLENKVLSYKKMEMAKPTGSSGNMNIDTTTPHHRISDSLANAANMMVKDRKSVSQTNHQLYWTSWKTWDVWEWLIMMCTTSSDDTVASFSLEDIHCGFMPQSSDHPRRNHDKPHDPHVCCIWYGFKTVVDRLTDPNNTEACHALEAVLQHGLHKNKWAIPDIIQGIFATFVYTFEVKKSLSEQQHDGGNSSKWPSHYGYVNKLLRDYFNPLSSNTPSSLQDQYKPLVSPFVMTLQNFLLECLPPVGTLLTFRGINVLVARLYNTGEYFIWSAFSSSSKDAQVAMEFGEVRKKQGSFFQLQVSSGRDISQFSMFPGEAEVLLPANTAFQVGYRMSDTLLTLTNFSSDIVTCAEVGSGAVEEIKDEDKVQQRLQAIRAAEYLYDYVSKMYVTPRIAETDNAPEKHLKAIQFFRSTISEINPEEYILPWNSTTTKLQHRFHLLLADGGMGKTMTTVRLVLDVIYGHKAGNHPYTPMFVSLPQILKYNSNNSTPMTGKAELKYKSLSDYLLEQLVLPNTASCKQELTRQPLVVFLDSLDEVTVDLKDVTETSNKSLFELLALGEFSNAIFVMTCRRETFHQQGGRISFDGVHDVLKTKRLYLRPPGVAQMKHLMKQVYTQEMTGQVAIKDSDVEAVIGIVEKCKLAMSTPFLCTLAVEALVGESKKTNTVVHDDGFLNLYSIYHNSLLHHYQTKGIRKVWNYTLLKQVTSFMVGTKMTEEEIKTEFIHCAQRFGSLLAVHTFLENTWPTDIDVNEYRNNTKWFTNVVQHCCICSNQDSLLIQILRRAEEDNDGRDARVLIQALFDMQPLRAESTESVGGKWCFRHKTIHEHLIAIGLLEGDEEHGVGWGTCFCDNS